MGAPRPKTPSCTIAVISVIVPDGLVEILGAIGADLLGLVPSKQLHIHD